MNQQEQKLELLSARLQALSEWRLAEEASYYLRAKPEKCKVAQYYPSTAKLYQVLVRCGETGELLGAWQDIIAETKVEATYKARQTPEFREMLKAGKAFIFHPKELGELTEGAKKKPKALSVAQWADNK